ncbi:hypothetical protein TrRE_jg9352, partial [Triparma retinervis]
MRLTLITLYACLQGYNGYNIPKPFSRKLPSFSKVNKNAATTPSTIPSMYFDDVSSPNNIFQGAEAEIIAGLKDWTRTNLLSPLHSPDPEDSSLGGEDGSKVFDDMQYYTIGSKTPEGILSSFFGILKELGPIKPNTATFIALTSTIDYDVFSTIDRTIDITLPLLPSLSSLSAVTVTHYHPQFKNAPRLLYVGRHSPTPVFVVVGKGEDTEVFDEGITAIHQDDKERE